MVRIALAPCSPFSVTPELMRRTAELAERLDVRLHTHLAEDPDEDTFCLETYGCRPIEHFEACGWGTDRSWVAHCIYPNEAEIARLGGWGTGVAHCPSSNMMIGGGGMAPVADFRAAGVPVGPRLRRLGVDRLRLAVDGGPQRAAARPPAGRARRRSPPATRWRWRPGVGRLPRPRRASWACWRRARRATWCAGRSTGIAFAGALTDPVEAGCAAARRRPPHGRGRPARGGGRRATGGRGGRHPHPPPGLGSQAPRVLSDVTMPTARHV